MWRPFGGEIEFDLDPVTVNGRSYAVDTVFTNGRTASASIKDNRIVIRIPRFARASEAQRLFLNLRGRMARMMERHPERFEKYTLSFRHGQALAILGREFHVVVEGTESARSSARVRDDMIMVRVRTGVPAHSLDMAVTKLVTKTLCRYFAAMVKSRMDELNSAYLGADVDSLVVKDIRSRWGSYSSRSRRISISVRLLFAPQEILDYVIVHELCHSVVHNHSRRFWSRVAAIMPDYRSRVRWLRSKGDMLGSAAPALAGSESIPTWSGTA